MEQAFQLMDWCLSSLLMFGTRDRDLEKRKEHGKDVIGKHMSKVDTNEVVDMLIVGAGPVGLYAAFYAALRQMSVRLIDSMEDVGGQLVGFYPDKYVYDVPGFPRIVAANLINALNQQAVLTQPVITMGQTVSHIAQQVKSGLFTAKTEQNCYLARTILVAVGIGALTPKKLEISQGKAYEGIGLYYSLDVAFRQLNRPQNVIVVGIGPAACMWVQSLCERGCRVTWVVYQNQFRIDEALRIDLATRGVQQKLCCKLTRLEGDKNVRQVVLVDVRTGLEEVIEADTVLVNLGMESSLAPMANWSVNLSKSGISVDGTMQSSLPGVFAAGDVAAYPAKLKLLSTGFSEAAIAVNHAKRHIQPTATLFPGHSTNVATKRIPNLRT